MNKNINVSAISPVISPNELQSKYEPNPADSAFINSSRRIVEAIVNKSDKRLLVVVGPCSIHDYDSAITYAQFLQKMQTNLPNLFLVMRVYFEKPRSRTGWKGFIYDPDLNNTGDINKGLDLARKLLLEITRMRIPIGCEFLDLITPQYLSDLVSWGAIGARTSESQTHRQLASGLSMPVGFKNLTDGDYEKAINGIISASCAHSFLGIDDYGRVSNVTTNGNKNAHLILRGGKIPNYQEEFVEAVAAGLKNEQIQTGMVIDCSHGNSQSQYQRQTLVAIYVKRLRLLNRYPIVGIMLESNLKKGSQKITSAMTKGVSVTDGCIDVDTTSELLTLLNSETCVEIHSLGEIRKIMRNYDEEIYQIINGSGCGVVPLKPYFVLTPHIFEQDKAIAEICNGKPFEDHLGMLIACRFGLCEKIADIKYRTSPYNFLRKNTDLLKLITDREIEAANLNLFPSAAYLKIMDVSKMIQVMYLEKLVNSVRIGYLFGKGTFSEEAVSKNFRGNHISYPDYNSLKAALDQKEVDFILIPTYNSLIGGIIQPESYWEVHGTIDHRIELCLYSNLLDSGAPSVLYLESHVHKEAENYIVKHFGADTEIIQVNTSKTGCINCIKDIGVQHSMTISSKNNDSNFLHLVDSKISEHNITTFSLIGM